MILSGSVPGTLPSPIETGALRRSKEDEGNMLLALPSEGGCQCGEIRYRLIGEPVWLAVCHCNECKRQSGGVFGMSLRMHEADVKLISGEPKRWSRPSDSGNLVILLFLRHLRKPPLARARWVRLLAY
jgi:hypothetical protein